MPTGQPAATGMPPQASGAGLSEAPVPPGPAPRAPHVAPPAVARHPTGPDTAPATSAGPERRTAVKTAEQRFRRATLAEFDTGHLVPQARESQSEIHPSRRRNG